MSHVSRGSQLVGERIFFVACVVFMGLLCLQLANKQMPQFHACGYCHVPNFRKDSAPFNNMTLFKCQLCESSRRAMVDLDLDFDMDPATNAAAPGVNASTPSASPSLRPRSNSRTPSVSPLHKGDSVFNFETGMTTSCQMRLHVCFVPEIGCDVVTYMVLSNEYGSAWWNRYRRPRSRAQRR